MSNFLGEDRAPLEATSISKKQMIVVCPNCKTSRSVSVNWWSSICSNCGKYFNKDNSLDESEAESTLNQNVPINKDFTTAKAKMEKAAYEYKDKVMEQKRQGKLRKHEPDGDGYWE